MHEAYHSLYTRQLNMARIFDNAAGFLGRTDTIGSLDTGKDADIVLL